MQLWLDFQSLRSFNMHFPGSQTHTLLTSSLPLPSLSLTSLSLSSPSLFPLAGPIPGLTTVAFIGLVVGTGLGGLLLITLVIVMIVACVYYFVRKSKSEKQGSHKYGVKKGKKHKNRNLYDAYWCAMQPSIIAPLSTSEWLFLWVISLSLYGFVFLFLSQ